VSINVSQTGALADLLADQAARGNARILGGRSDRAIRSSKPNQQSARPNRARGVE